MVRIDGLRRTTRLLSVFLVALAGLVHCHLAATAARDGAKTPAAAPAPKGKQPAPTKPLDIKHGTEGLPVPVQEMREAILAAARSGRIDELKTAIEWNELRPAFSSKPVADPIAFLKSLAGDAEGREILAVLVTILESGYVTLPLGRDLENNRIFVWPYYAELPPAELTPAQEVDAYRLVRPAELKAMREKKKYTSWRLAIGADGTWHYFQKAE
ncbi:MAG: hypothetical protein KDJ41_14725 [Hyphomicrobiaceae bacterium]|nr:hypothetical protein [Hyphomicrobiaceae bacterium]